MACTRASVWSAFVVGLGCVMASPRASAELIVIAPSLFSGSENVARFNGSGKPLPYTESGATFEVFNAAENFIPSGAGNGALTFAAPNLGSFVSTPTLRVTFATPVSRAGFLITDLWATTTLSIVGQGFADPDGVTSLGQSMLALSTGYPPQFVGFASSAPMTRLDLTFNPRVGTSYLSIDDFRFEGAAAVPEASTLSLILLGAAGAIRRLCQPRR